MKIVLTGVACIILICIFFIVYPFVHCSPQARGMLERGNRLGQIYLALNAYHDKFGNYPPISNMKHSWRVMILPFLYIEDKKRNEYYSALYKNIRIEEPWDSEYNKQYHSVEVDVFCSPSFEKNTIKGSNNYYMFILDTHEENTPFFIDDITRQSCWMCPNDSIKYLSNDILPTSSFVCYYNGSRRYFSDESE